MTETGGYGNEQGQERESAQFELAQALGVQETDLDIKNPEAFTDGGRYVYFTTEDTFGKVSNPETTPNLAREGLATSLAQELGVNVPEVRLAFKELSEGRGVLALEKLLSENGILLSSRELLASIEGEQASELARAVVKELISISREPIPDDGRAEKLGRPISTWRFESPDTLKNTMAAKGACVTDSRFEDIISEHLKTDAASTERGDALKYLATLSDDLISGIDELVTAYPETSQKYLVHNDASPNNTFFEQSPDGSFECKILDFEHAGTTNFPVLSLLTDLENYYGRLWPNPEIQKAFVTESMKALGAGAKDAADLKNRFTIVRSAVIYGTLHLSSFPMSKALASFEQDSPNDQTLTIERAFEQSNENGMAKSLIGNVQDNLSALEASYESINQQFED